MALDANGKVTKPQGWVGPEREIEKEIQRQIDYPIALRCARIRDWKYVVTGRMKIYRQVFGLRDQESEGFTDAIAFPSRQQAETRLAILQEVATFLTPPHSTPMSRSQKLESLYLDAGITELSALTITRAEITLSKE